jgi:hypothetical protein
VASARLVSPQRRPTAERLAHELRTLPRRRKGKGGSGARSQVRVRPQVGISVRERFVPGALAGISAGWVAAELPFYPSGWPLGLAAIGAGLGFAAPRAGLVFALATAFFPLANVSLGLGIVYAVLAAGWAALNWRDARAGLLVALGPLLAPVAGLALLPLAAQAARGRARRAAQVAAAVLLAAVVAGLRKVPLPFDGSAPPLGLGITGSGRPSAVAHALWAQLSAHPTIALEALLLAAAAVALPHVRGRGPWAAAFFGAGLLAATALAAPAAAVLPLCAAAWLTAAALAFERRT